MKEVKKYKLVPIEHNKEDKQDETDHEQTLADINKLASSVISRQLEDDIILMCIPKLMRYKAKALLNYLHAVSSINWDERGQVIINHELIPHSHIADLIKSSLFPYKNFHPVGVSTFQTELAKNNIPKGLIHHYQHQQKGQGEVLPPPGLPEEQPESLSIKPKKQAIKWLKL